MQGFLPAELMLCSALFDGIGIAQVAACFAAPACTTSFSYA
jgi:hypothetical protein